MTNARALIILVFGAIIGYLFSYVPEAMKEWACFNAAFADTKATKTQAATAYAGCRNKIFKPERSDQLLAEARRFKNAIIEHLAIEAALQTSWQDGKVLYDVVFYPLGSEPPSAENRPKPPPNLAAFKSNFSGHQFDLLLSDTPFELLKQQLEPRILANEKGEAIGYSAKGNAPMSAESYARINSWTIVWRRR